MIRLARYLGKGSAERTLGVVAVCSSLYLACGGGDEGRNGNPFDSLGPDGGGSGGGLSEPTAGTGGDGGSGGTGATGGDGASGGSAGTGGSAGEGGSAGAGASGGAGGASDDGGLPDDGSVQVDGAIVEDGSFTDGPDDAMTSNSG